MTSTTADARKPLIAWVDHDKDLLKQTVRRIGDLGCSQHQMQSLSTFFTFIPVIVDPAKLPKEQVAELIRDKCVQIPDLIMVDLHFGDHTNPDMVDQGRQLALKLQGKMAAPVGVFSRHPLSPLQRGLISSDRFAVFWDRFTESYDGPAHIAGNHWLQLFTNIIASAQEDFSTRLQTQAARATYDFVVWASDEPKSRSRGFCEFAPQLIGRILSELDPRPKRVLLSQMGGGFSGSFLVKAVIEETEREFVIKIDEDPSNLEKELKGYLNVQSLLQPGRYLAVFGPDMCRPAKILQDWWGAFAIDQAPDAEPLLNHRQLASSDLAALYSRVFEESLLRLYGDVTEHSHLVQEIIVPERVQRGLSNWNKWARYHDRRTELSPALQTICERALGFLANPAMLVPTLDTTLAVPWVERAHNDFNCRNILYNATSQEYFLIDFPQIAPNLLATDVAKAEAELVLTMMDYSNGRDGDFIRLPDWSTFTDRLASAFMPDLAGITVDAAPSPLAPTVALRT